MTSDEVTGNSHFWPYHASSVDALEAVGVELLHFHVVIISKRVLAGRRGEAVNPEIKTNKSPISEII